MLLGLALEGSGVGAHALRHMGIEPDRVRLEVEKAIQPGSVHVVPAVSVWKRLTGNAPGLPQSLPSKRVVEYAISEARGLGHNYVGTEHILLGLLREQGGVASRVLQNLGVTVELARTAVVRVLGSHPESEAEPLREGCEICSRITQIRRGEFSGLIAELHETYAILGENQGYRGWCVLYLKGHREHLSELDVARQCRIFGEVALVARAIREIVNPRRINYECLGNVVPHIHWHIIPRHADDPEPTKPVWGWSADQLKGTISDAERGKLCQHLARVIRG